ncbi:MAG: hypothetical protein RJB01_1794 [Actinomycetota bacterium]
MWDYPRPPRAESSGELVEVVFGGDVICRTTGAVRVLETSHPPTYYLPMADFTEGALRAAPGSSVCEFKGHAAYFDVIGADGSVAERAAWGYPDPWSGFEMLRDMVALYSGSMDECRVDGEIVVPQEGAFYGGWITSKVVGPFKGGPGTSGW